MLHKASITTSITWAAIIGLLFILIPEPIVALDAILLTPPFAGTFRVTAYFDHEKPHYKRYDAPEADGYIWIYNGQRKPALANPYFSGDPYPYDGHDGWDWTMPTGTNILAVASGTVVKSTDVWQYYEGFGKVIIIAHNNNYYTLYAHLDARLVQVGDSVTTGQHIAASGNSGGTSTGEHLHFGVLHGGYSHPPDYAVDPFGWRGSGRDPLFSHNGKESICLWNGKPGDQFCCSDIIVEDGGDGWVQDGAWTQSTAGNGLRQHWTNSWNPADYWVEWRPPLRYSGYYKIYAFIPIDNSTTSSARYLIRRNDLVSINQNASNHFWVPLGTHWLERNDLVYLGDYTGEPTRAKQIVADAMKFTATVIYLPDVKNSSEWLSSMVIRNNTSSSANVTIHYYNANGGLVATQPPFTIAGSGNATITPPVGFSGSAVVVSSEDVSVVVHNINASTGHAYSYNAIAAADPLNPGWIRLALLSRPQKRQNR